MTTDIIINSNLDNILDPNLERIKEMRDLYKSLIYSYVNKMDTNKAVMKLSTGGFDIGQDGYPIIFFQGEYCLVDGEIYKKQ